MKHNQFFFAILLASVSVPCSFAQELRLRTDNIDEIVAAMTLEEKAHLLVGADDEVGERGNIVTCHLQACQGTDMESQQRHGPQRPL